MLGSSSTIKSFHVSTAVCSFLTGLPPHGSPPATMNWYQSDLGCFDTKHQFHSLSFRRQINYSSSLQGWSEFSHQKGNFHSLCFSLAQEGKTKRGRQEGAMLELLENGHKFPPWDATQRDGMSLSQACTVPAAGFRLPESSLMVCSVPHLRGTERCPHKGIIRLQGERSRLGLQEVKPSDR